MAPEVEESAAVGAALTAWRRKAADVLLAVVAIVHLPLIVVVLLGFGPPMGLFLNAVAIAAYLTVATTAVLRRIDYRARLWACLFPAYFLLAVLNVALPQGPYAQIGLFTMPILLLVLFGARVARVAVLANILILVVAPILRVQPGIALALAIDPVELVRPAGLVWMQTAAKAGFLLGLMVLLDRLHRFLLDALAAQCRATSDLERETLERVATQKKMEGEMLERRRLEREIADIGDEERRRLGHELHDGVCQSITAALLHCQALEKRLGQGGELSLRNVESLNSLLTAAINEAHDVAVGLCPLEPAPGALAPALRALTKRLQNSSGIRCEFLATGNVRVPDPVVAQHLYRIAQEALSNAVRHSRASRITVELRGGDEELVVRIKDDGVGLPAELPAGGMGLHTMAYRAHVIDSTLHVESASGGVRVSCHVPRSAGGLMHETIEETTHGF